MSRKIAFICTGNMCRSPMAEYLLRTLSPKEWELESTSYGIMTVDGKEASTHASIAALEEGIDMSGHRSRALRSQELRLCDLIFTMTASQKEHILCAMSDLSDRVFCLTEFGRKGKKCKDIPDPMGGDLSVYQKCFQQIRDEIKKILPLLGDYFGLPPAD